MDNSKNEKTNADIIGQNERQPNAASAKQDMAKQPQADISNEKMAPSAEGNNAANGLNGNTDNTGQAGGRNNASKKQKTQEPQITCVSCKKSVSPTDGKNTKKGFVCTECLKKRKTRNIIIAVIVAILLIAGGVTAFVLNKNHISSAKGFDGIGKVTDTMFVNIDSVSVEFNIATATVSSMPVSAQTPIENIEEFKAVFSRNIDNSKTAKTNTVQIPTASLLFAFDSWKLSENAENMIKEIASIYNSTNKQAKIAIKGYACNIGGDIQNNWISMERAEKVKNAFVSNGVDPDNIKVEWYGKSKNEEFNLPNNAAYRRVIVAIE